MRQHRLNRADLSVEDENPLNAAVASRDRDTIEMVRRAVETRRLVLAYQPVVLGLDPARIGFHEALIRILDDTGRPIPAREFIGAVEHQELGRQIDCVALEDGLATLARQPELRISVNMSARSIGYPRWLRILRKGVGVHPTIGERLILEITESSAITVPELVIAFMDEWQAEGISFAIDDFGAGVTAFRYFRDFFFDMVKIDAQFIRGIHRDPDNQVLVRALMSIAGHFGMVAVAESVESPEDAAWLQAEGIDAMQGYLFGAPTVRPAWISGTGRKSA